MPSHQTTGTPTAYALERFEAPAGTEPIVHPDVAEFWNNIAKGRLSLQRCAECGTLRFPAAPNCFECLSDEYAWEAIEPRGVVDVAIEAHSAVGALPGSGLSLTEPWRSMTPYISGVVTMATEGIRLPGRIFCVCSAALEPGTEVRAVAIDTASDVVNYGFVHSCTQRRDAESE